MKSPNVNLEAEIASAANQAVGRPGLPIRPALTDLPPIEAAPRRKFAPSRSRSGLKPDTSKPFDVSDVVDQLAAVDADGRRYPKLMSPPPNRVRELEIALEDQWKELSARCIQIADLCNVQQQQAAELQVARDAVDDLNKSVTLLQAALTEQENEAAAAKQALASADQEKAGLQAELDKVRAELDKMKGSSDRLLQQAREFKIAFDDRGMALASARQRIASLEADLAAKGAEMARLAAPIEAAQRRHRDALNEQSARFEAEVGKLARSLAERDQRINKLTGAHAELVVRCNELMKTADTLETAQKSTRAELKAQRDLIQVLEALLKVERAAGEQKIRELTDALEHERAGRAASERLSAAMRKDIVHLLPKLVAQRQRPETPAEDPPASRSDAA